MIRLAIISLFSLLVLLPACRTGVIYGYYFFNKAYITQAFCENVAEPMLMCSGKCYVNNLIEAQSASDSMPIPTLSLEDLRPTFQLMPEQSVFVLRAIWRLGKQRFPFFQDAYRFMYTPSNFKPPRV